LEESLEDKNVLLCGQLVNYGHSALTRGLEKKYPSQVITYPVSENLMNASALGLSLAGKRPVMFHERFDFCMVGMDALVNHIPFWRKKRISTPLVILCVVGYGAGQGPQQNNDYTPWFDMLKNWDIEVPTSPEEAYRSLKVAISGDSPVMYVAHRQYFETSTKQERYFVTQYR
jgi:pyruvate dehydrogenase E1 component beta subunit